MSTNQPLSGNILVLNLKSRLEARHGTTPAELKELINPLFLWMYDHDIKDLLIARDDKKALITVDGQHTALGAGKTVTTS